MQVRHVTLKKRKRAGLVADAHNAIMGPFCRYDLSRKKLQLVGVEAVVMLKFKSTQIVRYRYLGYATTGDILTGENAGHRRTLRAMQLPFMLASFALERKRDHACAIHTSRNTFGKRLWRFSF